MRPDRITRATLVVVAVSLVWMAVRLHVAPRLVEALGSLVRVGPRARRWARARRGRRAAPVRGAVAVTVGPSTRAPAHCALLGRRRRGPSRSRQPPHAKEALRSGARSLPVDFHLLSVAHQRGRKVAA
jgi:hypothetical protein